MPAATPELDVDRRERTRLLIAAAGFAVLMVGVLVVAVAFPDVAGGPSQDVPLGGKGRTTNDNTAAGWLRAGLAFGVVAAWAVLLLFQLRKARRRRAPSI